jgi:UDP-N-acetylmuramoyl-tripeptide--D-alanyl-D-alanine ligase
VIRMHLAEVLDSTGAELLRGEVGRPLAGVSTDTRSIEGGALFVALQGPSFDGNRFAAEAVRRGAGALLLRGTAGELASLSAQLPGDVAVLVHPDPRRALSDLALWHRSRLSIPVIGITGSCGKTTTKNVLVQLLAQRLAVVGSPNSFNNDIGVPHTLFLADETTEALVVELGTNRPGEIAALCRTARPTAGILTNVGASHLEGLGSVDGVAREKSDLPSSLPREGFCVLSADCAWTPRMRSSTSARVLTVGIDGAADLVASDVWFHSGGTTFRLEGFGQRRVEITTPLLGRHNVQNVLAALAACVGLGLDLESVLPAVGRLEGGRRRMERIDLGDLVLMDDSYNANPESAEASVRVLAGLHGHKRRVLVLGDMLELGPSAAEHHHRMGMLAAAAGIDLLVLVGELVRATAAGALEGGLAVGSIVHAGSAEEAADRMPGLLAPGDVVLVKGSRRIGLEKVVARITEEQRARSLV